MLTIVKINRIRCAQIGIGWVTQHQIYRSVLCGYIVTYGLHYKGLRIWAAAVKVSTPLVLI
jgi:hypothetical protein